MLKWALRKLEKLLTFALHEFLSRHGFAFFGLYELSHHEDGRLYYANALFINPARLRAPVGGAATA